jgi:hypothetical protein
LQGAGGADDVTHAQEIQIELLKGNGWRRRGWAMLRKGAAPVPLLEHPTGDFVHATIEPDGRVHYHQSRRAMPPRVVAAWSRLHAERRHFAELFEKLQKHRPDGSLRRGVDDVRSVV